MSKSAKDTESCKPAYYKIEIKGKIPEDWSDWWGGMELSIRKCGEESQITTLFGKVTDQAALRGILCRLWDLNLTILSVDRGEVVTGEKEG